jgi:penicillin-binding protein 1C
MKTRALSWLFLVFLLALLALSGCTAGSSQQLGARPAKEPIDAAEIYLERYQPGPTPRIFQTTHIYDRHGTLIGIDWDEGRRTWVKLDRISKYLIDATIATEDSSFYRNAGVDAARIAGAALANAQTGDIVSGASTITMQLARLLFLPPEERMSQTMDRKILEAGLAQELTTLYSKDEILEMYLNLLNYSHGNYGPEAAAQNYFGKPAADLTFGEATLLAGIPQQPASFDLFTNFDAARGRQRVVLDMMVRHGYLTQAESDAIFAEPITLNPNPEQKLNVVPHFVYYVEDYLDTYYGQGGGRRSGLTITTTLDLPMQNLAQGIVAKKVKQLQAKHNLSNGALVALRPYSGEVLVMVGSANYADAKISGQVNVARSARQPGSSIKPILYAAAIDDDLISPATVLWDIPVSFKVEGGKPYRPRDYDGKFHGPVTARYALANSYNIPAVKLLNQVGIDRMLDGAQAMGIKSLEKGRDYYGLALTLGGGEVTLLELTNAYTVLASDGQAVTPNPILEAHDSLGRKFDKNKRLGAQNTPAETTAPLQAIKSSTAFLLTDILSDNGARTPAFGANSPLKLSQPAAAKTGTTDDWRDNWTIGYTRYLVAGTWAGNSNGRPMRNISGVAGAAPIWHDFMEAVIKDPALRAVIGAPAPEDAAAWQFVPSPDVELLPDCPPGVLCRADGEYFAKSWLDAAGELGPLADSVAKVPSAPVYAAGQWAAYCRVQPAALRPILRLPGRLGLPEPGEVITASVPLTDTAALASAALASTEITSEAQSVSNELAAAPPLTEEQRTEQLQVIAWSVRRALPINLGPCEDLPNVVPAAFRVSLEGAGNRPQVTVDLSAAMNVDVGSVKGELPGAENAGLQGEIVVQGDAPAPQFALAEPVKSDANCPGYYIMGRVINREGAPMADVRVMLTDEWMNQSEAVTKSGEIDRGNFDFPIHDFANTYTVVLVDGANQVISDAVVIKHLQDGDASPCHHITLVAY